MCTSYVPLPFSWCSECHAHTYFAACALDARPTHFICSCVFIADLSTISHLNAELIISTLKAKQRAFHKPQFAYNSVTFLFTSNTHFYFYFYIFILFICICIYICIYVLYIYYGAFAFCDVLTNQAQRLILLPKFEVFRWLIRFFVRKYLIFLTVVSLEFLYDRCLFQMVCPTSPLHYLHVRLVSVDLAICLTLSIPSS